MHKIVFDTNTLVSAVGWKGAPRKIFDLCVDNKLKIITSNEIIDEFIEVIFRPKFNFIHDDVKLTIIRAIISISDIVEPKIKLNIIKDDEKDNKFIECAITGNAKFIISGDSHLLKLKEFKGIKIMNSSKFLKEYYL
ncbi:putative toxin-antitoxin system toxin component, PIN family [[Eubacterium] cellulosolvens]